MPRRRRGLTDEDRRLWEQVAGTATRLAPVPPAPPQPQPLPRAAAPAPARPPAPPRFAPPSFRIGETAPSPASGVQRVASPAEGLAMQALRMDAGAHRRMTRGRMQPEARIDLHGMTLAVAQPVLERFIFGQHAAGRRLVLVITGKGKPGTPEAPLPVRPGALRHYVPLWLHRPPLAQRVLQVTVAHHRHGGEGAYYVYLRR